MEKTIFGTQITDMHILIYQFFGVVITLLGHFALQLWKKKNNRYKLAPSDSPPQPCKQTNVPYMVYKSFNNTEHDTFPMQPSVGSLVEPNSTYYDLRSPSLNKGTDAAQGRSAFKKTLLCDACSITLSHPLPSFHL